MRNKKLTDEPFDIVNIFEDAVLEVKNLMNTGDNLKDLQNAVDIKLTFSGVHVTARGGLALFRKKRTERSEIEIILATRITPD